MMADIEIDAMYQQMRDRYTHSGYANEVVDSLISELRFMRAVMKDLTMDYPGAIELGRKLERERCLQLVSEMEFEYVHEGRWSIDEITTREKLKEQINDSARP